MRFKKTSRVKGEEKALSKMYRQTGVSICQPGKRVSHCLRILVSEKLWKIGQGFAERWAELPTKTSRSLMIKEFWRSKKEEKKRRRTKWAEKTETCRADPAVEKERISFFQESASVSQLWGEAFISLMHCITAGLLEKSPAWMKKIRTGCPSSEQIRTLWAVTHL